MLNELLLAGRRLVRRPAFAFTAAGTLAIGIAASTAVFSTVNSVLLRPLPFPNGDDIYTLGTTLTDGRFTTGLVAPEELLALERASDDVQAVAGTRLSNATILTANGALQTASCGVSPGFFDLFEPRMLLGRAFAPEDYVRGAARSVVLSHRGWHRLAGGDPAIVGKYIELPNGPLQVVGVADLGFDVPAGTDFWYNLNLPPFLIDHTYGGYLRLRHGATLADVEPPMKRVMADLAIKYPGPNGKRIFVATPILESIVGDLAPVLLIVFSASGLLLVIAGVNVTNLLLTRSAGRSRELAVRVALGAGRARVVRQVLAESLVLAVAGGLVGAAGAVACVRALHVLGASQLPRLERLPFDWTVLAFSAGVILAIAVGVSVAPALATARADVAGTLNDGGRGHTGGRLTRQLLAGMMVLQIAVTLLLVAGAGRLVQSFAKLAAENRGFAAEERLVASVKLDPAVYREPAQIEAWLIDVQGRLRVIGATSVEGTSSVPLAAEEDATTFVDLVNDPATDLNARPNARLRHVTPGFFAAMDMPIVSGHPFTARDRRETAPVAIVNEAFARLFLSGRDPLREQITLPGYYETWRDGQLWHSEPIQIIGVVADARYASLDQPAEQTVFLPQLQSAARSRNLVIQSMADGVASLIPSVRTAIRAVDSRVPVTFTTMGDLVDGALSRQRLGMILMSLFGAAAVALAAIGVFGVTAYAVSQRERELAVRLALGASSRQVCSMVLAEGARLTLAGIAAGLLLAWWTGRLVTSYVYEVGPFDPVVIAVSVGVVATVAIGSTLILARRASALNASEAMRA